MLLFHCVSAQEKWPTRGWSVSTPAAEGPEAKVLAEFDAEIASGKYGHVDSLLIIRHGKAVYDRSYKHDYDRICAKKPESRARSTRTIRRGRTITSIPGGIRFTGAARCTHGTNEYNFAKLENPPKDKPTKCAACGSMIRLGEDGYSMKGKDYFCWNCSGINFPE